MGFVYANITLSNPIKTDLQPVLTKCLVNTESTYLVLPQSMASQLELSIIAPRVATTADGIIYSIPYARPYKVKFEYKKSFVGAIIMEVMNLIVEPKLVKRSTYPKSPNNPHGNTT